jgi:hypothetical protein
MYRCFRPDARANLPSIIITAHSLHLHIGVDSTYSPFSKLAIHDGRRTCEMAGLQINFALLIFMSPECCQYVKLILCRTLVNNVYG